jgi:signal transduction histidine kinase/DNA-binding response OmpR family regulator
LIEDNRGDFRLLQKMLAQAKEDSFELERVNQLAAGLERLEAEESDVVLLDLSLPDSQGLDTLARVQAEAPQVPIIVLSGLDDKVLTVKAVREGAQDYLVKGQIDSDLLARSIRYAIERKRTEQETQRRATHLEALNAVIAAAAAASDLPNLLETALDHTLQALNLEAGAIWRSGQYVIQGLHLEPDQAGPHEALATGLAIVGSLAIEDWRRIEADDPLAALIPLVTGSGIRASLVVPLLVEERRIGGLAVVSDEPRYWPADEIVLAEAIGQQLGAAAERLRLFQAEQEQRALAEALQEAAAVVSSTLEADLVLDRILGQVERVVVGDAFNIMLMTQDGKVQVARWRGYEQSQETAPETEREYHIEEIPNLLRMAQTGEPVIVIDTATDHNWVPLEGREWLRSYVGAPIRVGDLTVGFLNVNSTTPDRFNSADAQRLQAFANHTATAIENARLYRELRNYAEQLEQRVEDRTAQIQTQYAQLEAILDSSSDGIIVTDRRGEIQQTNPIAQTWLARTLSPEDAARLQEAVRDLSGQAEEQPEMVLELTGLDLQLSAAPIEGPGANEAAAVIAVHDVSHLKALDRMKSHFVSNVSHELRTPITTIKLYAALMQRTPPNKWEEYLDVLVQEADRQARLVEDILQISRIDSGRLEMKPRPTPLNELVEISFVNHRVMAEEHGLTLEYDPAQSEPTALVDPDRVTQVLTNLIGNAINYTPEEGKVMISTGKVETEGRVWATVTVADTGMGISKEEMPHIFERFFRGEQPRAMQVPGTGLGLTIAKEIVELQGGRVVVESEADVGTSFTVWLPLAD